MREPKPNRNPYRTLLLILTFLSSFSIYAQEETSIQFRHLTMKEGLADGWVHESLMDSKGMIWFATHDGLSRYDGHHFKKPKYYTYK